ncbi:CynX/NimT family MFS transporter [Tuberibacillus sp. Marseille-P3662]|uniref:CynX/NimT family MFS transporter n=1 Tax=Tuberibacillus sp. Marseille-P3662 TaxID=1965358 RepID=UPI000A1CE78C|nr:MFS transporter [Tuberibacillus sp. Marseille-P3662]
MQADYKKRTSSVMTRSIILVLGIVFIAANLRPAITSVGPLVESIQGDLLLSHGVVGLITTIPLLAFAVLSPLAPKLSQTYGNERVLFVSLMILCAGIWLRSSGSVTALFIGTLLVGCGIAACNVLLPGLIKERFSNKVGLMTSVYSTSMGTWAALASGLSVPISQGLGLGWQVTLILWSLLAIIAIIIWIPQIIRGRQTRNKKAVTPTNGRIWRSGLAWQVTLFMGLQSFAFYVTVAWLPELLHDQGMAVAKAGWMLSLSQFVSLPANFLTPLLAGRLSGQRGMVAVISVFYFVGFGGLLFDTDMSFVVLWVICLGLCQGASISLSLTFFGLRARTASQASELSGMAQSIGYLLAAVGPLLIGSLYDWTHSWVAPLVTLLVVSVLLLISGLGAGRNEYVLEDDE